MIHLENRDIIVTGSASGIGRATAFILVELGATVHAVDINGDALKNLKKEGGESIHTHVVDVADAKQVADFFELLMSDRFPDSLVNNAGIYFGKSILEYEAGDIEKILSVNIASAILFSKHFAQHAITRAVDSCIVNISSVSGQEASSDAVYGASKAAIIGLTKSCALNFAPHVRVNAVAPGVVDTPMMQNIPEERLRSYHEHELIQQPTKSEDVASTIAFLLSGAARHYTGAVFDLNNGCYMR